MYCKKCGALLEDNALFCGSCGNKVIRTSPQPMQVNAGYQEKRSMNRRRPFFSGKIIFVAIEMVIIFSVLCIIAFLEEKRYSPEHVAEQYFVNVVNGNWEKAFLQLNLAESDFINTEEYKKVNKYNTLGDVDTYRVEKPVARKAENSKFYREYMKQNMYTEEMDSFLRENQETVNIYYFLKGSNVEQVYEVPVTLSQQQRTSFFQAWRVWGSEIICTDYKLYIPQAATVTVDGILLNDHYLYQDDEGTDYHDSLKCYLIPEIFCGPHMISVEMDGMETVENEVVIGSYDDTYRVEAMKFSEDTMNKIAKLAADDMRMIYQAAMSGTGFDEIKDLFVKDTEYRNEIESDYMQLCDSFKENDEYKPENVSFYDVVATANNYSTEVEIYFNYDYHYYYIDWWDETESPENYQGDSTNYFDFVNENGNWVLKNLGCGVLYYYY